MRGGGGGGGGATPRPVTFLSVYLYSGFCVENVFLPGAAIGTYKFANVFAINYIYQSVQNLRNQVAECVSFFLNHFIYYT
jgi:hypothetical protein